MFVCVFDSPGALDESADAARRDFKAFPRRSWAMTARPASLISLFANALHVSVFFFGGIMKMYVYIYSSFFVMFTCHNLV